MYQNESLERVLAGESIIDQQILPGMGAEPTDGNHLSFAIILLAKDTHFAFPVCQPAPKGVGGLPGDDQDGIATVLNIVLQMM